MLAAALLPGLACAAPEAPAAWDSYQVIMWQPHGPAQLAGLRAMGFTAARVGVSVGRGVGGGGGGANGAERDAVRQAGLHYYLENVATDFYAPYHRYTPGRPVTWAFEEAKARLRAGDLSAFERQPSLSDAVWLGHIRARLREAAAANPAALFVNLADESGIGDLAAAWDADTSAASLRGMREWLRGQYGTLEALNAQWGSRFGRWDEVVPELTDAALRRGDDNYSAWSDFKAWMDVAFARAVREGAAAVHAGDPGGHAALEGGQVPGWGGYDYSLLAPAVDVMEIYDFGNALDLALAFNPALLPLRTSFGRGAAEVHAAWQSVLHGGRGMVVWDEADDVVMPDGAPGPRGREIEAFATAAAAVFPALRAALPDPDEVAVLVDAESFRLTWLLDRRAGDHNWAARDAEREYDDTEWRASRRVLVQGLAALGVQPRFVSAGMLEGGRLGTGMRVLFLPHAIALSDAAVEAVRAFEGAGGTVLADTEPGLFDGHGRRRAALPLPGVAHPQAVRLTGSPPDLPGLAKVLAAAGIVPRVRMLAPDGSMAGGVEARWFRGAGGAILAVQAAQPGSGPRRIALELAAPASITDLRHPGPAVTASLLEVVLDAVEPTILSLSPP